MGKYDEDEDNNNNNFDDEVKEEDDFLEDEETAEEAVEDDEIDELEEGFMEGYEEGERSTRCTLCHALLDMDFVEEEMNGESYRFCSENHAEIYKHKLETEPEEED